MVGEREVTGVEAKVNNGIPSKQYTYKSDSIAEDIGTYLSKLRKEGGWLVTEAYDLTVVPGRAQLGKASKDEGKILLLSVAYEDTHYAVKLTKIERTIE